MHKQFFQFLYGEDNPQILQCSFTEAPDVLAHYSNKKDAPKNIGLMRSDDLAAQLADNEKHGRASYFLVNPSGTAKREKHDIKKIVACFADIDNGFVIDDLPLEPSAIIGRSDGKSFHIYYAFDEALEATPDSIELWEKVEASIVAHVYGDNAVKDLPRVLRVPGSAHLKNGLKRYDKVTIRGKRYNLDQLKKAFAEPKRLQEMKTKIAKYMKPNAPYKDGSGRNEDMYKAGQDLGKCGIDEATQRKELHRIVARFFEDSDGYENVDRFIKKEKDDDETEDVKELIRASIQDFFYCLRGSKYIDMRDPHGTQWDAETFNNHFAYLSDKRITHTAHKHRLIKEVHEMVYIPKEDRELFETVGHKTIYNTYDPPKWDRGAHPEGGQLFFELANHLIPNDEERRQFLDMLAAMIQRPQHKLNYALLLFGETKGSGKTLLLTMFERLFGEKGIGGGIKNTFRPENNNLAENYNGWLENVCLIHIEEIYQNEKRDFMNKIKPWITTKTLTVRKMRTDPYTAPNFANFITSTNYPDALLFEDDDDRRWFVVKCRERRLTDEEKKKYLAPLINDDKGFFSALYNTFKEWPLDSFDWYGIAPKTDAKTEMSKSVNTRLDDKIETALDDGLFDVRDFWTIQQVVEVLAGSNNYADVKETRHQTIAKALKKAGFAKPYKDKIEWCIKGGETKHKKHYYIHPERVEKYQIEGSAGAFIDKSDFTRIVREFIESEQQPFDA